MIAYTRTKLTSFETRQTDTELHRELAVNLSLGSFGHSHRPSKSALLSPVVLMIMPPLDDTRIVAFVAFASAFRQCRLQPTGCSSVRSVVESTEQRWPRKEGPETTVGTNLALQLGHTKPGVVAVAHLHFTLIGLKDKAYMYTTTSVAK